MNKDKLIEVLGIQSYSGNDKLMVQYLFKELNEIKGCKFEYRDDGNIYVTKGQTDFFPCVVAHMDTVHKIVEDLTVLRVGEKLTGFNQVTMEQTGIGGDDKVGIFIALECLKAFDHIKVVFFCDEEIGCYGSYDCDLTFFDDCGFVLQCDRNGNKDFIDNAGGVQLSGKSFKKAAAKIMRRYGYEFEHGMMTDVMALKENGLGISCANMSCGYYRPHSNKEYVNMDHVDNCLSMVMEMIGTMGGNIYLHTYYKPVKKEYKFKYNAALNMWDGASAPLKRVLDQYKDKHGYDAWDDPKWGRTKEEEDDKLDYCECCSESAKETTYVPEFGVDMCNSCLGYYQDLGTIQLSK